MPVVRIARERARTYDEVVLQGELQQRDHGAQGHARASCVAVNSGTLHLFAEEIPVGHGHTGATFAGKHLGHPCIDRNRAAIPS